MSGEPAEVSKSYPRGSEWRRWDLQVHTPFSALNNGFGQDFDAYAKVLFEKAIEREIAVIGVTDYFTIEGFKKLRSVQEDSGRLNDLLGPEMAERARQIRLLPNIEFRLDDFVRVGEHDSRVNAHLIFSDDVPAREIEENLLSQLRFVSDSAPGERDSRKSLSIANLTEFGKRLKEEEEAFKNRTDLEVGMTQAAVSHTEITDLLNENAVFKNRFLFVVVADEDLSKISWKGQGHSTRKVLVQKSHMLFSANRGTREFALGQRSESVASFENEFRGLKPCVHGSDAHKEADLFEPADGRQLWVGANPTFDGLVQLCLEPADRVYIGNEPPSLQRVRASATKSIEQISFKRSPSAGSHAEWFSGDVPFNPGLVAVIGKKGSGKSALADILGLLGDSDTSDDFSFLTGRRFLNPRQNLGRYFKGRLLWRSGDEIERALDFHENSNVPERVRHIPQNYLEKVCEEIQESTKPTLFDRELEGVIFSHVPNADRLGRDTLGELIHHSAEETEAKIALLRQKLSQLNRQYVELRRRGSTAARQRLTAELSQRRADLEAHRKAKPQPVSDPSELEAKTPEAVQAEKDLEDIVAEIEQLDEGVKRLRQQEGLGKRRLVAVERMLGRVRNLSTTLEEFYEQSSEDAQLLHLDARQLVRLEVDTGELQKLGDEIRQELEGVSDALDEDLENSDASKRKKASVRADGLRKKLAEPQRRHQEYQRTLSHWKAEESEIEGSENDPKSVKGLEAKVAELDRLPEMTSEKQKERDSYIARIFLAKSELLESYREVYRPVQRFVAEHAVAREVSELSFDAVIAVQGLEDGVIAMIDQRKRGSFQGDEGRERLRDLISHHDFSDVQDVEAFLAQVEDHLDHDIRAKDRPAVEVSDQLMRDSTVEELYDFLFGLDYLKPRFKLLWRDKPLDQLSPGERGTLLLIFYLLIDREDIPLVIDQPEENLDNETVAELLVPAVKHAKQFRQIVLVTHNPNLAVVCDADQIVHASIDKSSGNRITYTTGAIEDPAITQLIVDVLEGTKPAFDLRDAKYEVLDRAT